MLFVVNKGQLELINTQVGRATDREAVEKVDEGITTYVAMVMTHNSVTPTRLLQRRRMRHKEQKRSDRCTG